MKNLSMAEAYMDRAKSCLREARGAMQGNDHPGVVRRSQECVEFSLKAALRLYGIEYPREHDVSQVLTKVEERFPEWFSDNLGELGEISRKLAELKGPSMYGDEEKGIPPSELLDEDDAEDSLSSAEKVHDLCSRLLREFEQARGK